MMGLRRLDDRVMIGPCLFKTMRQKLNGLSPIAIPDQETGCGGAKSTHDPDNIFHFFPSSCFALLIERLVELDAKRLRRVCLFR
jgi:hypothetical protein